MAASEPLSPVLHSGRQGAPWAMQDLLQPGSVPWGLLCGTHTAVPEAWIPAVHMGLRSSWVSEVLEGSSQLEWSRCGSAKHPPAVVPEHLVQATCLAGD